MAEQLGPYRIQGVLGRGGMGTVYVGVHQQTGHRAAVKVLAPGLASVESFRSRFAAEIETLKRLKHPHIVDLYGFGEQDGRLFYAMELVEATSLQDELIAGRRFTWREVSQIGIQVCSALKQAHDHGVIHRDLKPANLLLDAAGQVKLTDFGIARFFGQTHLTVAGGVLGTADYMSPEQAEGRATTVRSDLYSLGCVLYALLAGRPPFCGKSLPEVVHKVRFDEPLPIRRFAPDVPAELEEVLRQLLEKDPQQRIATALAVSHRLQAMEHALSLRAREIADGEDTDPDEHAAGQGPIDLDSASPGQSEPLAVTAADLRGEPDADIEDRITIGPPGDSRRSPISPSPLGAGEPTSIRSGGGSQLPASEQTSPPSADGAAHFTVVDEQQRMAAFQPAKIPSTGGTAWWKIGLGMAALLAVVAGVLYSRRPLTADQLYRRIQANAKPSPDHSRQTGKAEQDIQQFLQRFSSDPRVRELSALHETIQRNQLRRKLHRYARRNQDSVPPLSPVEEVYIEAIRLRQVSSEAAAARLEALINVFGRQPNASTTSRRCVELARRELDTLRASIRQTTVSHRQVIEDRLRQAKQTVSTDPDAARAIWRGVIRLYSEKPWAADLVQNARQALANAGNKPKADH